MSGLAEVMGRERWREVSDVAQVVANYLMCHPQVRAVRYPGLKSDPEFNYASRTLVGGFGPYVDFVFKGSWYRLVCEPCDPRQLVLELEEFLAQA